MDNPKLGIRAYIIISYEIRFTLLHVVFYTLKENNFKMKMLQ